VRLDIRPAAAVTVRARGAAATLGLELVDADVERWLARDHAGFTEATEPAHRVLPASASVSLVLTPAVRDPRVSLPACG
jgi:hypothetical protein